MEGLILIIIAAVLIIAEAHVPSFGILGIAGIVSLLAGGHFIVEQGGIFGIPVDWGFFLGIATVAAVALFFASYIVARNFKKKPVSGVEGMIGHEAKIVEWSGKSGLVHIQGELWAACTNQDSADFSVGDKVIVGGIDDMLLEIRTKDSM